MKIDGYQVTQTGISVKESASLSVQSLTAQTNAPPPRQEAAVLTLAGDKDENENAFYTQKSYLAPKGNESYAEDLRQAKLMLLQAFVQMLTGKKAKLGLKQPGYAPTQPPRTPRIAQGGQLSGEVAFSSYSASYERQYVAFQSSGTVITQDGRQFSFDLNMEMERVAYEQSGLSVRVGMGAGGQAQNSVDPLTIVFGQGAPTLSQGKVRFDLNADGVMDNISFAQGNSGFLALDKNADGSINDGSELFGPSLGNGFLELSLYDDDGNGWIDENDDIFHKLSVVTLGGDGSLTTFKLGDLGIGAIYLNAVGSQYSIGGAGDTQGVMRSSSVFLRENGTAGSIHHIDLTV